MALAPNKSGHEPHIVTVPDHGSMPGICPGAGVGSRRPLGAGKRQRQLPLVERDRQRPRSMHLPLLRPRQADRGEVQVEAPRDNAHELVHRLPAVRRQEDIATQGEQAAEFVTPRTRFARLLPRRGRQVARDDGHRQKGEQRDPVLRIGNRKGADRRQEEVVQAEVCQARHGNADRQARSGSRDQDDEQIAERGDVGLVR